MLSTMLAVTILSKGKTTTVTLPARKAGQALVRVERVGICSTDLALLKGYTDFKGIPGHEFAGVVIESSDHKLIGKRVTSSINFSANQENSSGHSAKHDPDRSALGIRGWDGAMAEYLVVPESALIELPDSISFAEGAMLEPLAAGIHAIDALPEGDTPILLIGDGRLAQLIARVALARGETVHVSGSNREKMDRLKAVGAQILSLKESHHVRYHRIIEASGSPSGLNSAINNAAPKATIILKSTIESDFACDMSTVVVNELKLIGSRCGDLNAAMELVASGKVEVDDLIDGVYPLRDAQQAFHAATIPENIKIQIAPHNAI